MKILYFHQHFATPRGSFSIRSYEMARSLVTRGHKVTMVCGSYKGGEIGLLQPFISGKRRGLIDGIDVIEFNLPYSNADNFLKRTFVFFKFALQGIYLALTEDYDLLFATTTL